MSAGRAAGSHTLQLPKRYLPLPYARLPFLAPDEYHRLPAPDGRRITGDEMADALVIKTPTHTDCWLLSDSGFSNTDMWKTTPEVEWDGISEFSTDDIVVTGSAGTQLQAPSGVIRTGTL